MHAMCYRQPRDRNPFDVEPTRARRNADGSIGRSPYSGAELAAVAASGSYKHGLDAIKRLRIWTEEQEARHVLAAYRAGCSWDVIAGYLGVKRQTAHARWARWLRPPDE
jgi:hypothetical protein